MLRVINVVGARPNFMKIAPIIEAMNRHPDKNPATMGILDLRPIEKVEVRFRDELLATITRNGFNRRMCYDTEMS